jgi:hypothetical protein
MAAPATNFREPALSSEVAQLRMKAENLCELAKQQFGPDGPVAYRMEDVMNSLQRLEWALLREVK